MRLNDACIRIREAFGDDPWLVGSATYNDNWRDVDVRYVMDDVEFDALFKGREFFWSLFCLSVSEYLRAASGLPIDFQVQRASVALEKFKTHRRVALGYPMRLYAGGGDAT